MDHIGPFGWADKPAEKHCWLICCERKILFQLKNKLKKTDYKPGEHTYSCYMLLIDVIFSSSVHFINVRCDSKDAFQKPSLGP
jgi:hypothetical protein